MRIDRSRVAQSFHRQAAEYDSHATVQARITQELVAMVCNHTVRTPDSILDVGCGTGRLLAELHGQYPESSLYGLDIAENMVQHTVGLLGNRVCGMVGDAEQLPFSEGTFDLVVSSSTLQWLESLDRFFTEAYRVLNDDGLLCCAFFGGSTLREVQQCYRDVVGKRCGENDSRIERLHRFIPLAEVQTALEKTGFEQVVLGTDKEVEYYDDLKALLRSIQRVGAGSSPHNGITSQGGLGWRTLLQEMVDQYQEKYERNGKVPANYEVFYLFARKISSGLQ